MIDIATIGADNFRQYQGDTVALADAEGNVVLTPTLRTVADRPQATHPNAHRQAFTLVLTAPLPCEVASGHFTLGHAAIGIVGPLYIERSMSAMPNDGEACFCVYFN